jgi:polysaccharide deacetylase family protein (PEP-CTERM system associated)
VDVEDWFQVWALSSRIARSDWDRHTLRVEASCGRLLDLFDAYGAKATFFTLGWIAERCPRLVERIASGGHELASHGYDHVKVTAQDEDAFRADVIRTKRVLEELSGRPVTGYRAASFSIDRRTPFAHRVLRETGHAYSSSSHPIAHDHYGDPHAPLGPHRVDGLPEIPVAVREVMGRRQTLAGGGWFRAMPLPVSKALWRGLEAEGRRGVFYLHPWEVDPGQPSVPGLPLNPRLRHRLNLRSTEAKLAEMLRAFRWGRIDEVFAREIGAPAARAA